MWPYKDNEKEMVEDEVSAVERKQELERIAREEALDRIQQAFKSYCKELKLINQEYSETCRSLRPINFLTEKDLKK